MSTKLRLLFISFCLTAFAACGGGSDGILEFEGPLLDISELEAMQIDHLYFGDAGEDEAGTPDLSVYLKDVGTDQYIACFGGEELKKADTVGVYYGGLNANIQTVDDMDDFDGRDIRIVFVEKDADACPATVQDTDDIIGESEDIKVRDLLNTVIESTNGSGKVMFKTEAAEKNNVNAMDPASELTLIIDQVYFDEGDEEEGEYFLYAETETSDCEIEQPDFPVKYPKLVYAHLDLQFSCLEGVNLDKTVIITLWKAENNISRVVGTISESKINDLIQEKVEFEEENGYIRFRQITPEG